MLHLIKCSQNTRRLVSSAVRYQPIDSMFSLNKLNITHKLVRNYSLITLRQYVRKTIIYGSSLTGISCVIAFHHKFRVAKCDSSSLNNEHIDDIENGENSDNSLFECVDYVRSHENFNISKLWPYLKLDTIYFIVAISSALIVAIINIEIPICLGSVMNVLSRFASNGQSLWSNHFLTEIKNPALKVFELYVFQSIFTFLYISSLSIIGEKMASRLRKQLFANIIRFDATFYDSHKSGEIISRLTSDVQEFKSSFKMCISQGLRSTTQIIGCSISLFMISPPMTVLMGTIVPGMVLVGTLIGSFLRNMSKEAQAQLAKASGIACEAINNVRTVKAFAMEESQSSVYNKEINISEELNCNLGVGIGIFQGITNLALNSIVLGTLLFGGYLLSKEKMSAGNLMSFLVAVQTIQRSLAQLSLLFGQYIRGVSAANRIFEYLQINECHSDAIGIKLNQITGEISFRNVTFSYPTRSENLILKNFSINLMPGKVTAICGLSGEGKSTIAALLEKFYDLNSGAITIDGIDLKELDTLWLRRDVIGYINQEPVLFATTIKENIRFGKPDATDEEIYAAAKIANAHAFIQSFPDGYETLVGERGVTVSGGQKQRIAIARAIIKNPKILILDEATSALDSESEATVQQAIENVMNGRTVLVIAHRLTTIQNADVIAVISNGKIVELGKHNELLKHKRIYWQLFSQQSNYFNSIEE